MLYRNGKLVDLSAKSGDDKDIADEYRKKVKNYKEQYGTTICIKYKKHMNGPKINATGRPEPPPMEGFPLIANYSGDNGLEEWVYTESPLKIENGEYKNLQRHRVISGGEFYIPLEGPDAAPDFAFFVLEKHNFINSQVVVYDVRSKAKKEVDNYRVEAKLKSVIFGEGSPLVEHNLILRNVSKRWGIVETEVKSVEELQIELYDKVMENERRRGQIHNPQARAGIRGIEAFLEDVKYNEDTKLGAKVMSAVERGIVKYDYDHNVWHIPGEEGGTGNVLCSVPLNEKNIKNEVLITSMLSDKQKMNDIENALGEDVQLSKPCELEEIEKTNDYMWMKKMASLMGVGKDAHGLKMKELSDFLIESWKDEYLPKEVGTY